jgi:hypothetical protein
VRVSPALFNAGEEFEIGGVALLSLRAMRSRARPMVADSGNGLFDEPGYP